MWLGALEGGPRGIIAETLRMMGIERSAERMRLFFDVAEMCRVNLYLSAGTAQTVTRISPTLHCGRRS